MFFLDKLKKINFLYFLIPRSSGGSAEGCVGKPGRRTSNPSEKCGGGLGRGALGGVLVAKIASPDYRTVGKSSMDVAS